MECIQQSCDGIINAFCDVIRLQCGVRQGWVLSPVLFTVYVNDVIMALSASGYGCYHVIFMAFL